MTPQALKDWRQCNGCNQSELANALSVHEMTISRWERGVREIPPFLHLALKWLESEKGGESMQKGKKKRKEKS